jgi:hypothetical protein
MEIWSAHLQPDVEHAIAVTVAAGFYVSDATAVARIENATSQPANRGGSVIEEA